VPAVQEVADELRHEHRKAHLGGKKAAGTWQRQQQQQQGVSCTGSCG
jgi:hypothetical protein